MDTPPSAPPPETPAAREDHGNGEPAAREDHGNGEPHVLVVPFPAQGHMLALLDLAALLAQRGGLPVTVAVTAGNAPLLDPLLASCPSVRVVTFPFPSTRFLPPGCSENTRDLSYHLFRNFVPALAALRAPLLSWCRAQPSRRRRVTAVVSDLFTGWTRPLAAELGAAHVRFSPCSAFFVAISRPLFRRMPRAEQDPDEPVAFPDVPGQPTFRWRQLPTIYRHQKAGDEASELIREILLGSLEAERIVVNSFAELEAAYLLPTPARPRVLAVGPLSEAWAATSQNRGGEPMVPASEATAWLDAFGDGAVVYVSFGTQFALSPAQAECVADALARSSAPFLWAAGTVTAVPEGFEAATAARGMVVRGWAPQVQILRHRAVGWFLTHCGMNGVLEAAAAGVAMLTWPMGADQFVDKVLLEEAVVAVHLAEGADAVPDAGEMAKAIAAAVRDEGKPVRERAAELGRKAAAAAAGSAEKHAAGASDESREEAVVRAAAGEGGGGYPEGVRCGRRAETVVRSPNSGRCGHAD